MAKAKKQTKSNRPLVTFEDYKDAQCVALAQLGQSDKVIMRDLELSQGQIQYRLHKAKTLEGYDHGYRTQWRNGESEVVQQIKRDMLAVIRKDIQAKLPQQIIHPTPEVVKV